MTGGKSLKGCVIFCPFLFAVDDVTGNENWRYDVAVKQPKFLEYHIRKYVMRSHLIATLPEPIVLVSVIFLFLTLKYRYSSACNRCPQHFKERGLKKEEH